MKGILLFFCFVGFVLLLRFLVVTGHPVIAIVSAILAFCIFIGIGNPPPDCECPGTPGCF